MTGQILLTCSVPGLGAADLTIPKPGVYTTEWATWQEAMLARNHKRRSARRKITQEEENSGYYQPLDLNLHVVPRFKAIGGSRLCNYTSGPRGEQL